MDAINNRFDGLKNSQRIGYLIGGFITHTLTIEERDELDAWVIANEDNMQLFEDMTDDKMVDQFLRWLATRDTEGKLVDMKKRLKFKKKKPVIRWWHYAAAACMVGITGLAIYYWPPQETATPERAQHKKTDIPPGSHYAELRLPSGETIRLDEMSDTVIGTIHIKEGAIVYGKDAADTMIHEIRIPRKGSYRLRLPDGSNVWLNAESSIRYPGAFAGDKRVVTVTGETYFEITKESSRPFIVSIDDVTIKAIGTAFNVNGFAKRITLTEGSVRVARDNKKLMLKPGDQIEITSWVVNKADIIPVLAWTKNQFKFRDATIEEVMEPVERWYDAKIIYRDRIGYHFNGTIDRNVPVSKVLELLEETGNVHFIIEGNTIIVTK